MRSAWREAAVALGVTAVVVLVLFRPLLWKPGALPRYVGAHAPFENADRNLNLWILAWTARAATVEPERLFDGNIYAPARNTLAGSETMLAHLPVTAPLWRATADATWVLKAEMAWGVGGTALAVYALLRFLGLAGFAAALGAAAVALEPGRINPLGTMVGVAAQPQYLGFQYAPLALLAILVWSRERRRLGFAALAVALALQSLACFYLGYYAFLTVPLFAAYVLARRRGPGELAALAASLLAGALLALPVALQYLAARRSGAVRPPDPELPYLGSIAGAGVAAGAAWIGPLGLALGAIALAATLARRRRGLAEGVASAATDTVARGALILAVAAVVVALGPELRFGDRVVSLPHGWLAAIVPGFGMLRGPIRALSLATLGLAVAGAIALSEWGATWGRGRRGALAAGGIALALFWIARGRVPIEESPLSANLPEVYRWLASAPATGALLEVPGAAAEEDLGGLVRESRYMIYSTTHWHALVNGYTAYPPVWGELAKSLARRLPDRDALQTLVNLAPLDLVVAHRALLSPAERAIWDERAAAAGLEERARFGDDVVYRVAIAPSADWRAAVGAPPSDRSLEGTSTAPLRDDCRRARVGARFPAELRASLIAKAIPTEVENASACAWPGLAVRPEGLIVVTATWLDAPPGSAAPRIRARLPHDLQPGASAATDALVLTPRVPGTYRLRIDVVQEGESTPLASTEGVVRVVPAPVPAPPSGAAAGAGSTE